MTSIEVIDVRKGVSEDHVMPRLGCSVEVIFNQEASMGSFKDKFMSHVREKELQAKQKEDAAIQEEKVKLAFENNFTFEAERVARPIFEEFVEAAKEFGYPAECGSNRDSYKNEYFDVRFIPVQGAALGANKSNEAVFVLKCDGSTQKVAHIMYYDQRPEKNGKKEQHYGLPSIKEDVIRRELEEFFDLAVRARDTN